MSSFAGPSYDPLFTWFQFEIIVFLVFTISAKLDPVTYVGNLTSVHFILMSK